MASKSRDEIRKTDFLKVSTSGGTITNVIAPNGLQIGLDDDEFRNALKSYGGISGSLTQLVDGTSYLIAGTNMSITTGSTGAVTIAALAAPSTETLSQGDGITAFSFDGSATATVAVDIASTRALSFDKGSALQLDFTAVTSPSHSANVADTILVGARGGTDFGVTTVSSILSLVTTTPTALQYPLEPGYGLGFKDEIAYSNTNKSNVLGVICQDVGGLTSSSLGVRMDADNLNQINTLAGADRIFVGQYSVMGYTLGYTSAQDIADLATTTVLQNALTAGSGLELDNNATSFDGSVALTLSTDTDGTTLQVGGSGLEVLKVPNTIADGDGITTLSYDGSADAIVSIDLATAAGLNFTTGELLMDVETLVAGGTPALSNEIAVSFGSAATRKVDLSAVRALFHTGPVIISGMLQVTGSIEATDYVMGKTGLSGSLTRLIDGTPYLIAGTNVTIDSASNGPITISSTAGTGDSSTFFNSPASGFLATTGSTAFAGALGSSYKTSDIGSDVAFFVSGSAGSKNSATRGTALFGGDLLTSGSIVTLTGLSGSLTTLADGNPYLLAGTNITLATSSAGAVTIAAAAGGGGPGDSAAEYLVLAATSSLSGERVLTLSTGLSASDAGSGGAYTLATHPQKFVYEVTQSHDADNPLVVSSLDFSTNGFNFHKNDIFLNGQLMTSGSGKDYVIAPASGSDAVTFFMNLLPEDMVIVTQS